MVDFTYGLFYSLVVVTFTTRPAWESINKDAMPILENPAWINKNWTHMWERDFSSTIPGDSVREKYLSTIRLMLDQGANLNHIRRAEFGCQHGFETLVEKSLYPGKDLSSISALKSACLPINMLMAQYANALIQK